MASADYNLYFNSADSKATGSCYAFSHPIDPPVILSGSSDEWEIAMVSAEFFHPGPAIPTSGGHGGVFINSNLVAMQTARVGSASVQLLYRAPSAATTGFYNFTVPSIVYIPLSANRINSVEISLTDGTGNLLTGAPPDAYTLVHCVIRRRSKF